MRDRGSGAVELKSFTSPKGWLLFFDLPSSFFELGLSKANPKKESFGFMAEMTVDCHTVSLVRYMLAY